MEKSKRFPSGKNVCMIVRFFLVLSSVLVFSLLYFAVKENVPEETIATKSKIKRSVCSGESCNEGLNKIEDEHLCPPDEEAICLTKDCTLTSATLLSAMDLSIDPCEDFYQFSCANFIRKNLVPDDKIKLTTYLQYEDNYLLQQKNLLEEYNSYGEPDVVYRLQEAYHVCINRSEDKDKELEAFKEYITHELDGWPMAEGDQWKPKQKLDDYFAKPSLLQLDSNPIFNIMNVERFDETTNTIEKYAVIFLNDASYGQKTFEKFYLTNKTEEDNNEKIARRNLLFSLLRLFGDPNEEFVNKEIESGIEMFQFFQNLTKSVPFTKEGLSMTIGEFNNYTSNTIDWLRLINVQHHEEKKVFTISDMVYVDNTLQILPEVLNKFSQKIIVNTVILNQLFDTLVTIGPPLVEKLYDDYQIALGNKIPKEKSSWKFCLEWVNKNFPLVLTRMFVKTYLDRKSKTTVDEMIQLIAEAYKQQIEASNWVDVETKARALSKADAIRRHVGYPEYIFNDTAIEKAYDYIPTVKSTLFRNMLDEKLYNGKQKIDEDTWFVSPLVIDAFYDSQGNSMWFPSGILQLPFFGENRPAAVNFAMIGSYISHEIGHAFDNTGRNYNEKGKRENWWSEEMDKLYEQKVECFINQYNEFCPENLQGGVNDSSVCVDGYFTLGENLADNTGLKAAYDAYKLWTKKHGEEIRLPGLAEFSPEQIFFISFAYISCENIPVDKWLQGYGDNSHAAENYRVLGPLSNNQDFWRVFNCPLGKMNRGNESCVFW